MGWLFRRLLLVVGALLPVGAMAQISQPVPDSGLPVTDDPGKIGQVPVGVLYLDKWEVPLPSADSAAYYAIIRLPPDSDGVEVIKRTYSIATGRMTGEVILGKKSKLDNESIQRMWYPNGQLQREAIGTLQYKGQATIYKNGQTMNWYPSGQLRREQKHRGEYVRHQRCFDPEGRPLPCPPEDAQAYIKGIGWSNDVAKYLQKQFGKATATLTNKSTGQLEVRLRFAVDSFGIVRDLRVYPQTISPELRQIAVGLVRNLPAFVPALFCGQPYQEGWAIDLLYDPKRGR